MAKAGGGAGGSGRLAGGGVSGLSGHRPVLHDGQQSGGGSAAGQSPMRHRGHTAHVPTQPRVPIWERPLAPPQSVRDKALAMIAPEPKLLKVVQPKLMGLGIDIPIPLGPPSPTHDPAPRPSMRHAIQALHALQQQQTQHGYTPASQQHAPHHHSGVWRGNSRLAAMHPGSNSPARLRRTSHVVYSEEQSPQMAVGAQAEELWEQPAVTQRVAAPTRNHPPPFSHTSSSPALLPSSALTGSRQAITASPSSHRRPP